MQESNTEFYIVPTPIGNLEDITYRSIRVLSDVDVVLCEDTRVTKKLLDHYNISTSTESYHAQSSIKKMDSIISRIREGTKFALVSDAGTPAISDPGSLLVSTIRKYIPECRIISLPGASALTTALSASGFFGNQFTFYGFLPHKKGRSSLFDEIKDSSRVSVFYESPHRIMKTLESLSQVLDPERNIMVGRELTKIFEENPVKNIQEMHQYFLRNPDKIRGEFVVVVDKKV
jgi:16S rRNA (cytidine1402-2'-O)-methyltransferase